MAQTGRNKDYTKEYNQKMLLRLLRTEPLSRSEIARRMGLTRAAVSLIAGELLTQGRIEEGPAAGARAPLQLCGSGGYAAGIYLNRDSCTAGLVDLRGRLLVQKALRPEGRSGEERTAQLAQELRQMLDAAGIGREKLWGIGVSAPGPLDGERGMILNPPRFDLWHHAAIGPQLESALGVPVYLENNAACLGCYNIGKPEADGSGNFLLLLVDSGVGSCLVVDHQVVRGGGSFTSELGHTSIHYRGRKCACGNRGCLEAYASVPNLLRGTAFSSWRQLIEQLPESGEARALLAQEAEYLAAGIVNATNLVSIDTVLLAGEVRFGIEVLAPLLEAQVNRRTLRREMLPIRVCPACTGDDAGILAAADVVFDRGLTV